MATWATLHTRHVGLSVFTGSGALSEFIFLILPNASLSIPRQPLAPLEQSPSFHAFRVCVFYTSFRVFSIIQAPVSVPVSSVVPGFRVFSAWGLTTPTPQCHFTSRLYTLRNGSASSSRSSTVRQSNIIPFTKLSHCLLKFYNSVINTHIELNLVSLSLKLYPL